MSGVIASAHRATRRGDKLIQKQKRNIDISALKFLRRKYGFVCPKGTVIFEQGQTSGEFYIVLQGKVELWIEVPPPENSPDTQLRRQVLATMEGGNFFGEMAAFTGEPRSATATAVEDTSLLYFDERTALELLRTSPVFGLGIIQTLCDRVRDTNLQMAEMRKQPAAVMSGKVIETTGQPSPAKEAVESAPAQPSGPNDRPPPREDIFILKAVTCPVCRTEFKALSARPQQAQVAKRESDFHDIYRSISPLHYTVYVCPKCYYAAYPDDFLSIEPAEINERRGKMEQTQRDNARYNFWSERIPEEARRSFELGLLTYERRRTPEHKKAALRHRAAWIAREMGDAETERKYLAEALASYQLSHEKERLLTAEAEGTLCYLVGDILVRLDRASESAAWFKSASESDEAKRKPALARQIRDRWQEVKNLTQKEETAGT